jgi:hypothetical protein
VSGWRFSALFRSDTWLALYVCLVGASQGALFQRQNSNRLIAIVETTIAQSTGAISTSLLGDQLV